MAETEIIETLLRVARRRRQKSGPMSATVEATPIPHGVVRRREARFTDVEAILELKERSGLSQDSLANWQRLWKENPARTKGAAEWPIGWVQECDGQIVGYLGSIPLLYQYGDQTILASTTTSYAVDPAFRSRSLGLVGSFFRQEGCELYLDTTATPAAGRVMQAFKAEPLPQRDYGTVFFWVLKADDFLHGAMKKLGLSGQLTKPLTALGSLALRGDIAFRKRRPISAPGMPRCREIGIEQIGEDFQSLWERKIRERPRLLAWRTPEVLRWHFRVPHSRYAPQVLVCYEASTLIGYAILTTANTRLGFQKSSIADLFVENDRRDVIAELLAGAFELAKKNGSAVLELMGFPQNVRSICQRSRPFVRKYPACPFFYKADRADLQHILAQEASWYAGPYDGDSTLYF